jgi:pantoate--beta-alanine ligase
MDNIVEIVSSPAKMRNLAGSLRANDGPLGLVPTMGALHEGHIHLIDRAVSECPTVVVSIFVNLTQFGPGEDYGTYPRDYESDIRICRSKGVAAIYSPTADAMYGKEFSTLIEVPSLAEGLCGPHRPGHFRGVATVVAKLFAACKPDRAYFGEKDYQQLILIRRMALDLNLGIEVIGCPTVREKDGLALSSRNVNLQGDERKRAISLSRGLRKATELFAAGEKEAAILILAVSQELEMAEAEIDYIAVVDPDTLKPLERVDKSARIAVAAHIGTTRLIDNIPLEL